MLSYNFLRLFPEYCLPAMRFERRVSTPPDSQNLTRDVLILCGMWPTAEEGRWSIVPFGDCVRAEMHREKRGGSYPRWRKDKL